MPAKILPQRCDDVVLAFGHHALQRPELLVAPREVLRAAVAKCRPETGKKW